MLIGSGAKGLQLTLAGFQYINTFNYEGKEITLSPTVMDALSTLVSSKSREVFDAQLTQLLDTQQISQEEYTLAQKLANEVANFDHQIEAEKESLKQQLMNGSDIDLQAEYAAYQEVFAQLEAIKEQYGLGTAETEYILNPSGPNLQLDITISNETELDTWMLELKEAMDFIQGVAEFKEMNVDEKNNHTNEEQQNNDIFDNLIDLDAEESLGGHSYERHGADLTLIEMEQRVMGTNPNLPQSRSALKFESLEIHQDAVNKAYQHYKTEIDTHFENGGEYREWEFDYVSQTGSGYINTGTRRNPVPQFVTTTKIIIAFNVNAISPRGYYLVSAYPYYPLD